MEIFKKNKVYDFVGWSKWGLILSVLLTIGAFYLFFGVGFNLGIDFAGGSAAQIQYVGDSKSAISSEAKQDSNNIESKTPSLEQIRALLTTNPIFTNAQVSNFGSEILIKIPYQEGVTNEQIENALHTTLDSSGHFEIRKLDSISAKVGDELTRAAFISLILATLAMMLYVSFRYEWRFALASIITLVQDIIIAAASVIIFKIDLNLEVIAALLALLGYAINDRIIIFDRIREKMLEGKKMPIEEVINEAISNTLPRTLLTSLTMFFSVVTLYIFGGQNIIGFSLPLLVGVVFATYSSMFVAPKLAILLGFSIEKYYAKEVAKAKKAEQRRRERQLYEGGRV